MVEPGTARSRAPGTTVCGAARYVAVGDCDPRIADAALSLLRDDGDRGVRRPDTRTAGRLPRASAAGPHRPTGCTSTRTGPSRPSVCWPVTRPPLAPTCPRTTGSPSIREVRGRRTAAAATPTSTSTRRGNRCCFSLRSTGSDDHPWPDSEDVTDPVQGVTADVVAALDGPPEVDDVDEHFVPPAPPPLPRLQPQTVVWPARDHRRFPGERHRLRRRRSRLAGRSPRSSAARSGWCGGTKDEPPERLGSDDGAVV